MLRLALVGAIGCGKSSVGNMLLESEVFQVDHKIKAVTDDFKMATHPKNTFTLVDMPGYNHNVISGEAVIDRLKNGTFAISNFLEESDNVVDAFLLVVKTNPRLALNNEVKELTRQFSSQVLQSVVVVVIQPNFKGDPNEYKSQLSELTEAQNLFKAAGAKLITVSWDNFKPWPGMKEELLQAIKSVRPYSKEIFLRSQREILEGAGRDIAELAQGSAKTVISMAESIQATILANAQAQKEGLLKDLTDAAEKKVMAALAKDIDANAKFEIQRVKKECDQKIAALTQEYDRNVENLKKTQLKELGRMKEEVEVLKKKRPLSPKYDDFIFIGSALTKIIAEIVSTVLPPGVLTLSMKFVGLMFS